jgi:hypothetical protein
MTGYLRQVRPQFKPLAQSVKPNLLVSGCSFTYNNSWSVPVSWPYYLRDLACFDRVIDTSQVGAGNNHVFNSIINEIESNPDIRPDNTLVIVMLSGMTRTDVIARQDVTQAWHTMSNYLFDDRYATLSIHNDVQLFEPNMLTQLCGLYKRLVDVDAQRLESAIRILALTAYLKQHSFDSVITSWKDPAPDLVSCRLADQVLACLDTVQYLGDYAAGIGQIDSGAHPTPDGHLQWTRRCLVPYLIQQGLATNTDTV